MGLNSFALKIIAIIAMTCDHIGYMFFPQVLWLRVIGRLTFPIMGYLIGEGFYHTRDRMKYATRLFLFALISALPFYLMSGSIYNVMFTLFAGVMALYAAENIDGAFKKLVIVAIISLCTVKCDWHIGGVWLIYIMAKMKNKHLGILLGITVCAILIKVPQVFVNPMAQFAGRKIIFSLSLYLAYPILLLYNGKRGMGIKYFFYIYYPAHILVLWIIGGWIK